MSLGSILRGASAIALAVGATSAFSAPLGRAGADVQHQIAPLLAQTEPGTTPQPSVPPDTAVPPPILPAPHMPGNDAPVVTLPPTSQPSAAQSAPAIAGLPVTPNGTVFSFADLAESLLGSVVY